MSDDISGRGDPLKSLKLLWEGTEKPKRGPRQKVELGALVSAAIEIADTEGLGAVSTRRVAEKVGISPMSFYTYIPGKAELLDLMLDTVYGETAGPDGPAGDWRARLERAARDSWQVYLRHPWLLQVATSRPPLGPHLVAKYDRELRAVDGIGLTDVEMDLVVQMVGDYVHGAARTAVSATLVTQRTGLTDEQWWSRVAPVLEKVLDPAAHPTAGRVGTAAAIEYNGTVDPARAFDFGLRLLLDGVEALIARASR